MIPPTTSPRAISNQRSARVDGRETSPMMPAIAATDTVANTAPIPCPMPNKAPSFRLVSITKMPGTNTTGGDSPGMPSAENTHSFDTRSAAAARAVTATKSGQPLEDEAAMLVCRGAIRPHQRG